MKRRLPSLNSLRTFEAVGRLGRMVAAADELSVTHGAVSRQIRYLEDYLELKLLAGTRKRPVLTQEGRTLLSPLTAAFDQLDAAIQSIQRRERETLDVSCLSSFMMRWLIPRLYRFNARHPAVDVRLSATDQHITIERDRLDVAISVAATDDPRRRKSGARATVDLFSEELGPVLAPELAADLRLSDPTRLPPKMLLRTRTRPDAWDTWSRCCGYAPLEPEGLEFEHYYFTLEAANAGLGICLTPRHLVAADILSGRLLAPFGFVRSGHTYFAMHRAQSENARLFVSWLADEAQNR